jgi:hypothetical protein
MKNTLRKALWETVVIASIVFIGGCAARKFPPSAPPPTVTMEKKDGLTELLGGGNKIFARYTTFKRAYVSEDIIPSPDYLQGKIVKRKIEICFEDGSGNIRVIKKLDDDKELRNVALITRLKYNPVKALVAFTTERRGIIFIISSKNGTLIQTINFATNPRWSTDGSKLLYTDTQDDQRKEITFSPPSPASP